MPHSRELASEPCRSRGGAGGAARGQWVRYPLRVVLDADAYADADTKVYGKVRALAKGRPCVAAVEKLAEYCGLAVSTVEKSLGRLSKPAPSDGVTELTRRQRSHKGTGTGRTTERTCRPLADGERYVSAPVLAADTLRGTLHRLYLLLRYTEIVEKRQLTLAEIAWVLRHHGGKSAGVPLAEAVVTRLLEELAALGWIALDKRAGYRGRHLVTVHDHPLQAAAEPEPTPDPEGGAAPDLEGGALAYKEDHQTLNDPRTGAGGSFRRRRDNRSYRPESVDTAGNTAAGDRPDAPAIPAALRGRTRPEVRPAYAGPQLTLSSEAWTLLEPVLDPVADLLPQVSVFMTRRIVHEILRQIRDGIWPEEIRDQIARLRRWTPPEEIRDPGRWLLGAVLPVRSKCGMTGCHWGFLAHTGTPCKACAELGQTPTSHPPHTGSWHECTQCQRPAHTPLPAGLCTTCRPTA